MSGEPDESNQIEAKLPWGSIKANGKLLIILLGLLGLGALQLYFEDLRQRDRERDRDEHHEIGVQMRINNYLISLPVEDRPRLIAPMELWPMLEKSNPDPVKTPFTFRKRGAPE